MKQTLGHLIMAIPLIAIFGVGIAANGVWLTLAVFGGIGAALLLMLVGEHLANGA